MKKLVGQSLARIYIFESIKAATQEGFTAQGISDCLEGRRFSQLGVRFMMLTQVEVDDLKARASFPIVEVKEEKL